MQKTKDRRDHYLPQGYLRGFIDPARKDYPQPLWYLDVRKNSWSPRSVKQIGHRPGFYDYATNEAGFEPADVTFRELENEFPLVRDQIEQQLDSWHDHLDFLLRFAQMMRARSLLFFEQQREVLKNMPTWTIKEISAGRKSVKLESMTPKPPPETFIQNRSILEMQAEIKKGAAWAIKYHWALRYTDTPTEPFIICESPVVSTDLASTKGGLPDMLIFPLSWKSCLLGTLNDLGHDKTARVDLQNLREIRSMYRCGAKLYVVSPTRVDHL